MYPNPLIMQYAGVYVKQVPGDTTHREAFELRPDLLVAWSEITVGESGLDTREMRGNWAVSLTKLSIFLTDEEEVFQENYLWDGDRWVSASDPEIYLKKRGDAKDIKDDLFFDIR